MKPWIYLKKKSEVVAELLNFCNTPFFEGMLREEELAVVDELIEAGLMKRVYEGAAGFMGLAKVVSI